ncbi:MAG: mycothiol synthase [Terrimesophilobacter sp.]
MSVSLTPSIPESLVELIAAAKSVDGQPPFSDQSLLELERGDRTLVRTEHGAAIVGDDEVELVIAPDERGRGRGAALVEFVLAAHPAVRYAWAHGDHPASRALAKRFGFEPVRTLLKLHAPVSNGSLHDAITAFRPGVDDAEWLALNARSFAGHPEQGKLTQRDLDDRIAEPWFLAEDFLVLRDDDDMIGFCWLKVEDGNATDGTAVDSTARSNSGEFYAVGIDPDRQGEGLGRALMDAGFARLASRGIRTAELYVEADNEAALALYGRYGFTRHTIDVRYQRTGG